MTDDPPRGSVTARGDKYGPAGDTRLLTATGVHATDGTEANPALSGDILGDWREEIIRPAADDTARRICSTPIVTTRRYPTLMADLQYRTAIA